MTSHDLIITGFQGCFYAVDTAGKKIEFKSRPSACCIVTVKGSILFTHPSGQILADPEHPVFLPQGLSYVNECLEDAESFVFNLYTLHPYDAPRELTPVAERFVRDCYEAIRKISLSPPPRRILQIYRLLYSLMDQLLLDKQGLSNTNRLTGKALEYLTEHLAEPSLTVRAAAEHCHISEVYLRKLFAKQYSATPFQMLTDMRMEKARFLTLEKRSMKEIAAETGYSDIYQFSRAYKRHFGHAPSQESR